MNNKWKEIWNKKGVNFTIEDLANQKDEFKIYSALKRQDGFDVSIQEAEKYYKCFYQSFIELWEKVIKERKISSAYEIGCGSGANLYLLQKRGLRIGGIDYSENLAQIATKVLETESSITIGEAFNVSIDAQYDVVFSDSVFAYFPDEKYGLSVLEKMYEKARKVVIVTEIFDQSLRDECEHHRREMFPDYDERYAELGRTYYARDMFRDFAEHHHCRIEFGVVDNPYYWNSSYMFNCCLYKA